MEQRIAMGSLYPGAYKAMDALDQLVAKSSIDKWYKELIRIKASQINGCAYCVHAHTQDAIAMGVDARKINLVSVWNEAHNHFTEHEICIIKFTEELTLLPQKGLTTETYDMGISLFGPVQTAEIIMAIITINAWNRIGVGLKMQPKF